MARWLIIIACFVMIPGYILAGQTGKIAGVVRDAQTGEVLVGATISVQGTRYGASSDVDGKYFIVGVPEGTYCVKALYVGYESVLTTNVAVSIDRTTQLDFKLSPSQLSGKEVVVVAKRPAIALDVTSSRQDISLKTVENAPLTDFNSMLNLQAGVVFQNTANDVAEQMTPRLSIRGGTSVGVYVDGMNTTEGIYSGSLTNFNLSEVKSVEILTGGFDAEYGNARSGIINVITKDGGSKYHFSFDYKITPAQLKYFGPSIYDTRYAPEWQLYGTPQALNTYWKLWAASPLDTTFHFTPAQAQQVWEWQHRPRADGNKPDQIVDASVSGPFPIISQLGLVKNVSFFTSLRYSYIYFAVPLARPGDENLNWFWKVTSQPTGTTKLTLEGGYQADYSGTTYNTPEVSVSSPIQAIYYLQYYGNKYNDGKNSDADRYRNQFGFSLNQVFSQNTYMDLNVNYTLRRSYAYPPPFRTNAPTFSIGGFTFDGAPQEGWNPYPKYGDFGGQESLIGDTTQGYYFSMGGGQQTQRDSSREILLTSRVDLVSQIGDYNQVKTGLQFNMDDMHENSGIVILSPPLIKFNVFHRTPIIAAYYAQDKIEFKGMIANLGIRLDYMDRGGGYYTDPYSADFYVDSLNLVPTANIKPFFFVSPRIGISHPITDRSKLFFNYGYFYSEPDVNYLYVQGETSGGVINIVPNANLKPERTIAYEVGFEQQLGNDYLFHISGYYRDITNQILEVQYASMAGNVISSYANGSYSNVRGFDVDLEKSLGTFFTGSLSLDYYLMSSGSVGNDVVYQSVLQTPTPATAQQATPGSNYTFLADVDLHTPQKWGPKVLGSYPLSEWTLSITHQLRSGPTFTWNPNNLPYVQNNVKWRDHQETDLKLTRTFAFGGRSFSLYADVYNVFNRKELTWYMRSLLLPNLRDWTNYMNSLHLPGDGGTDEPGDYKQSYIQLPPPGDFPTQLLFLNPRTYDLGIHVAF